jgi:NADP-dependent 3-hydroxy acid dehydrogenase YdfG
MSLSGKVALVTGSTSGIGLRCMGCTWRRSTSVEQG